jgi:hypothetical protein
MVCDGPKSGYRHRPKADGQRAEKRINFAFHRAGSPATAQSQIRVDAQTVIYRAVPDQRLCDPVVSLSDAPTRHTRRR